MEAISGEPVYAEGRVQGKKREAVLACALDACRILDSHDVLRAPRAGGCIGTIPRPSPTHIHMYKVMHTHHHIDQLHILPHPPTC